MVTIILIYTLREKLAAFPISMHECPRTVDCFTLNNLFNHFSYFSMMVLWSSDTYLHWLCSAWSIKFKVIVLVVVVIPHVL